MSRSPIHILSTRPLGEEIVATAASNGLILDEMEFIQTAPVVSDALQKQVLALSHQQIVAVFTSMNGVQAVADMLGTSQPSWQVGCIGQTTQLLVETLLPNVTIIAKGDSAAELGNNLISKVDGRDVYFFCSNIRRDELPTVMHDNHVVLHEMVVYETRQTARLVDKPYDAVLFFSPSAVRSFFSANKLKDDAVCFATGQTTANEIALYSKNRVLIAEEPGKMEVVKKMMSWFA